MLTGICVALLGLCVILGWHTGNRMLMQVRPTLVAMVYNAALGFLMCGLTLLLGALRFRRAMMATGVVVLSLGILTFIEYVAGVSFGIDQLGMRYYLDDELPFPGRMALSTALCFTLAGAAFLLLGTAHPRAMKKAMTYRFAFAGMLGAIVFAMGTVALTGYVMNVPTAYGWTGFSRMPAHGACGFLFIGTGLVAAAWERGRNVGGLGPRWLPELIGLAALTVTFSLYLALSAQEQNYVTRTIDNHAAGMEHAMEVEIKERTLALERMAERWRQRAAAFKEWQADARRYVSDFEGYKAIEWVDATHHIRWVEPLTGNEASLNRNLAADPAQRASLEAAREQRTARVSRTIDFARGQRGLLIYVALYRKEQFDGFMVGAVRIEPLLNAIVPDNIKSDYLVSIFDGNSEIYRNDAETNAPNENNPWSERIIDLPGVSWRARIEPRPYMLSRLHSRVPEATLLVGLLLSVLLAWAIHLVGQSRRRTREAVRTNHKLEREIAQRERTEEHLQGSEERYRELVDRSLGLICTHDTEGRLLSVNPAAARALGYKPEELTERSLSDIIAPETEPQLRASLRQVREQGTASGLMRVIRKDGTECVWVFNNLFCQEAGRAPYVLGHAQDVTKLKQMERELAKARDAALESARLKSEFLANMSHEIRTPMNGVVGMANLLLDTNLTPEQRDFVETIQSSSESLMIIINDILDFSKIEAGKLQFETVDFDLRHSLESVIELFAEMAHKKRIELASLVNSNVIASLRGDPGRLRQILTNLIGNAVKFTERGEVFARVTQESDAEDVVTLRFSVTDTGIGISPEAQARLFHAFIQADGSITRKYGGTGLGLTITKQLVELMGGKIGLESEEGKGSTFWFTARLEKQPASARVETVPRASLEGLRILLIDDNQTNRRIMVHQTESWGMSAQEAESGARALEMLRDASERGQAFDVVVLDLMMPQMDGFTLARAIKNDKTIAPTRLVLMPSFGQRGHGRKAQEAGIGAYLIKPVRQSEFFDCLATVMAEPQITSDAASEAPATSKLVTRHTLEEAARGAGVRLLIAEDNLVNQKVILSQIERLGYQADVVANGTDALDALARASYALVLMDCQMPVMDGLNATAEIRRREGYDRHTPIIAVTANAMQGERERCLDAGMDDYLAKPVKKQELADALARWITHRPGKTSSANGNAAKPKSDARTERDADRPPENGDLNGTAKAENADAFSEAVISERLAQLREECGAEMVAGFIEVFVGDTSKRLTRLRDLTAQQDSTAVEREAHSLKGSCANLGAERMASLCEQLEAEAESGSLTRAKEFLERLDYEFKRLKPLVEIEKVR